MESSRFIFLIKLSSLKEEKRGGGESGLKTRGPPLISEYQSSFMIGSKNEKSMFTHAEQFGIIACTTQSKIPLYSSSRRLLRMYVYVVL